MTASELRERFPNASEQFIRANTDRAPTVPAPLPAHRPAPPPIVERGQPHESLAADKAKARDPGRYIVRVTSYRVRLLDEDNLCEKFHVDALRYAGAIPTDAPGQCRIVTTQKKVARKADERTEIVIVRVP